MKKFSWGRVLNNFEYDFDGRFVLVTKYHPWKSEGCTVLVGDANEAETNFHCEELHESFGSIDTLLIAWVAHKNLGLNQHALVAGIAKALEAT